MSRVKCFRGLGALLAVAGLCMSVGCQTWLGGMTLPSAFYLDDNPDYIPRGPSFPLPNELARIQAANAEVAPPATGPAPGTGYPSFGPPN